MRGCQSAGLRGLDVKDRGLMTAVGRGGLGAARPPYLPITLADLITAIQDVVGPKDDALVVATVRHLLRSGQLTRGETPPAARPAPGAGVPQIGFGERVRVCRDLSG